jgi:hypothetical protein
MDRLPERWWWNPTQEVTALLERQRQEALLDSFCDDPARGNAYIDRLTARKGEAAAQQMREALRAHWRQRQAKLKAK